MLRRSAANPMKLRVRPLTPVRWSDLEAVFNAKGCSVARGCWCMYYRRSGSRGPLPAGTTHAQANRAELKTLVDSGTAPGLIGYQGKVPVGWVSLGPRGDYAKLKRSPVMKAVDDEAIAYARKRSVALLEAYPVDKPGRSDDESMWFGAKSMYDAAGFEEVARRRPQRPIVRIRLQ